MPSGQPIMSYQRKLPYQTRCNLPDCQKVVKNVYQINIDEHSLNLCSNDHARLAISRWNEKKEKGIKPGQPAPIDIPEEMTGDNLQELEGGE